MIGNEKAVEVLDTPPTAQTSKRNIILGPQRLDRKELDTLRARFALRGYVLQRVFRASDGFPTYHVTRYTQTRVFNHPHDVGAFLAVAESLPL